MSYDEHGGYPLRSPFRRRLDDADPLGESNETPPVLADDALLDRLASGRFDDLLLRAGVDRVPVTVRESELVLARVLVAWRRDVDSEPIPVLIEPGGAERVITWARRARQVLLVVSVTVLVLAVALAGVLLVVTLGGAW